MYMYTYISSIAKRQWRERLLSKRQGSMDMSRLAMVHTLSVMRPLIHGAFAISRCPSCSDNAPTNKICRRAPLA